MTNVVALCAGATNILHLRLAQSRFKAKAKVKCILPFDPDRQLMPPDKKINIRVWQIVVRRLQFDGSARDIQDVGQGAILAKLQQRGRAAWQANVAPSPKVENQCCETR